ncbi:MAG: glycosyltransferase, partial [Endozoicomonadaceae bacterium]|nr:glycosyltransferase [Endozoicomonadaceae bacterium]
MHYVDPVLKFPSKYYAIEDITIIVCVRFTEKNPWIKNRLALYSSWFIHCPQVLVIDLGSNEYHAEKLLGVCNSHNYHYHYENNKEVFSLSLARNIGFSVSKTDLLFFTDPDFIYERDIFQRLLKIANALDIYSNRFDRITMTAYHISQEFSELFEGSSKTVQEKEGQLIQWMHHGVYTEYDHIFEYISPYSNNFLCHRDFYDLVGGYSTDFVGHGSEDFEFIIRANLLKNVLPLPKNISVDVHKPNELDFVISGYEGFRRLAELETFSSELHGFRSFHLWHPRVASAGWYENNDRKRKVLNNVLSRYINKKISLIGEDYLPRNKRALCVVSNESQLIYFLIFRLKGYRFDVLSKQSQIKDRLETLNNGRYQVIFYYDKGAMKEFSDFFCRVKIPIKKVCLIDENLKGNLDNFFIYNKNYKYSNNSYAARSLYINTKGSIRDYIKERRSQLSFWQKIGSQVFSFFMTPFLSSFHKKQLRNDPQLFFGKARHPFSVWVGKKLCFCKRRN